MRTPLARIGMAALLLIGAYAPAAIADSGVFVAVTYVMAPIASVSMTDAGLVVRTNTPWTINATHTDEYGAITVTHLTGGATGGAGTLIEAGGLVNYTLVLDAPR